MSTLLTRFQGWHIPYVLAHGDAEGGSFQPDEPSMLRLMEQSANSWTVVLDGVPMCSGGTLEMWPGRHSAWAYLSAVSGRYMVPITRAARRALDSVKGRIEITVRADFAPGHRWAKLLGFEIETPLMRAYGPEGEDHIGYVRFNGR